MKRRRFILLSVLIVLGSILGVRIMDFKRTIRGILNKHLDGLRISDNAIDEFISEGLNAGIWDTAYFDWKKRLFLSSYFMVEDFLGFLPHFNKYVKLRDTIVNDFLLATDFFIRKMDETREIKYIGLYDPYSRPCANPFSSMMYPNM